MLKYGDARLLHESNDIQMAYAGCQCITVMSAVLFVLFDDNFRS